MDLQKIKSKGERALDIRGLYFNSLGPQPKNTPPNAVYLNGKKLIIKRSTGQFNWGYHGEGPQRLTGTIINKIFTEEERGSSLVKKYSDQLYEYIARLKDQGDFSVKIVLHNLRFRSVQQDKLRKQSK